MPSSPNYKRNYRQEYDNQQASSTAKKERAARNKVRRDGISTGRVSKGDGKDIDHITPLSKGGSTSTANTRVVGRSTNRSFKRNKDGSMK